MGRLGLVVCVCVLAAPAMAQGSGDAAKVRSAASNYIDLSKDLPVGKSRFAVNADGSAADIGTVPVKAAPGAQVSPDDEDERNVPRWARPGAAAEAKARCEANPNAPECRGGSRVIVVVPGKEKQAAAARPRIRFGRRR